MRREAYLIAATLLAGCIIIALAVYYRDRGGTPPGEKTEVAAMSANPKDSTKAAAEEEQIAHQQKSYALVRKAVADALQEIRTKCAGLVTAAQRQQPMTVNIKTVYDANGIEVARGFHQWSTSEERAFLQKAAQCVLESYPRIKLAAGKQLITIVSPVNLF